MFLAAGGCGRDGGVQHELRCGNGVLDDGELCDDGNTRAGDGCGASCSVEAGWTCSGQPSVCRGLNPSCVGMQAICSASHPDCCGSALVPGGMFYRDNDVTFPEHLAIVGDFWLDTYEITVGRFAKFVAEYPASKPAPGSGKNPRNPADPGWDPAWDEFLSADQAALTKNIQCDPEFQSWGRGDDTLAINCINWFEAYAFCIWDGGRLPSQLEGNYAAAGGSEQRYYPWSSPPSSETIDPSYAVYSPAPSVARVGSCSTKGDGRYGQADLAGNVWEWQLDKYDPTYPPGCDNCATLQAKDNERVIRGGSFYDDSSYVPSFSIDSYDPTSRFNYIGGRCARNR